MTTELSVFEKLQYMDDETLLTVSRIAKLIGVSQETVRRWIRNGKLTPNAPTAHYKIRCDELKMFLKRMYHDKTQKGQVL